MLSGVSDLTPSGDVAVYPVVETIQRDGICVELLMPAGIPSPVATRATELAVAIGDDVEAVGIMAVELFLTSDGGLVVNELALRPHNSGHATIDACETSQFENHLRAVLDWPLGSTAQQAANQRADIYSFLLWQFGKAGLKP